MITLSLAMIVKNEENTLTDSLESIKNIVDEIIIVDTGSQDKTKEIARRYTDLIFDFKWVYDFSAARNFSFSKATKDYIMWLDADDVIYEKDRQALLHLKTTLDPLVDVVIMPYNLLSKENPNEVICTFYRERIVKRAKGFKWFDPVHEYLLFSGNSIKEPIAITHKKKAPPTRRNLEIFEKYIEKGHELTSRNWFYYARELTNFGEPEKAEAYYIKFLETVDGLSSNYMDACINLADYYCSKEEEDKALKVLFKYFEKDCIRAEICCRIGYVYKDRGEYAKACQWFEVACHLPMPKETVSSVLPLYYNYIPLMEVSLCSYKEGNLDKAIEFNEKAAAFKPNDFKVLRNRVVLATVKEKLVEKLKEKAPHEN